MKKLLYLFLALLFPALIFVFLKYAGKNEFNIPVYFDQGVEKVPGGCDRSYPAPYLLDEDNWVGQARTQANVVVFPDAGIDFSRMEAALLRAQPRLSRSEIFWRLKFTYGALHHWLLTKDKFRPDWVEGVDLEAQIQKLISFAAAGFRAA